MTWFNTGGRIEFEDWRHNLEPVIEGMNSIPGWQEMCNGLQFRGNCSCGSDHCNFRAKIMCAWDEMCVLASQTLMEE